MNDARWYPTNVTLANGDVLVLSGQLSPQLGKNNIPQVWQTGNGTWRSLPEIFFDIYPSMHLAPNGQVFISGQDRLTGYLNTTTGTWTSVADTNFGYRLYGFTSVMYDDGKVLLAGGGPLFIGQNPTPPTATAEVIDLNAPSPAWRYTRFGQQETQMNFARRNHNATLLPDGKVLVTGGTSGLGFYDYESAAVHAAEMWDPATELWTTMASTSIKRGYHSTALLLPDGRVLSAGGDDGGASAEIYSPPYLFDQFGNPIPLAARPAITSVMINGMPTTTVGYNQEFDIITPQAATAQATWIRLSSVTHGLNMDQRINRLVVVSRNENTLKVRSPSDDKLCPPGYYMLFILNNGVPSVAKFIKIN